MGDCSTQCGWKSGSPRWAVCSISKGGSVSLAPVRGWEWCRWSKTQCLLEWPQAVWGVEWAHDPQPESWVLPRIA